MTPALTFGRMVSYMATHTCSHTLASPGGVWLLQFQPTPISNAVMNLAINHTLNHSAGSLAEELVVNLDPHFAKEWGFEKPQIRLVTATPATGGWAPMMKNYDKLFCRGLWNHLVRSGWIITHE